MIGVANFLSAQHTEKEEKQITNKRKKKFYKIVARESKQESTHTHSRRTLAHRKIVIRKKKELIKNN